MPSFQKLGKPLLLLFYGRGRQLLRQYESRDQPESKSESEYILHHTAGNLHAGISPSMTALRWRRFTTAIRWLVMSRQADDWCMVQAMQSGKIGWIQSALLSAQPIPTPTYFVQVGKVRLQDAPQKNASSPEVLSQGDKVRKLSENQEGWLMVLAEKDRGLGWIPASAVAEQPPATAPPLPRAAGPAGQSATTGDRFYLRPPPNSFIMWPLTT